MFQKTRRWFEKKRLERRFFAQLEATKDRGELLVTEDEMNEYVDYKIMERIYFVKQKMYYMLRFHLREDGMLTVCSFVKQEDMPR